ncbi:hypothetical protein AGABI1DRAFT_68155 [Agaricus bisporus var. burnettii JB137-S8]|uniref:tRNA(Ile)-lysidine synthetase n=1 Tax=Agaricus bisporus var. burnettii (strain JB137-S8 / ATCC MYA-4627 / FGSC 10392) TaxID=597362 RepID=K5XGD4_AGABU|nr:uncharacterized protein AGABI1DRAFT_68155 [Agaricus bisporus var. burnettii JB137-S8]EKM82493.1 hypothetical protein AGABI1DRAFT_68155 [Agaricus bisporus var. burnettii JB137-S8]
MRPRPISREEFARYFQRTRPPPAVANSGGPDSTCLLFLIQRFLADFPSSFRLSSLTVDHALQPDSADMARHAANTAAALRVPHSTSRIPWGTPPFPPLPDPSRPIEAVARTARYSLLWKQMQKDDIGVLALAHHNDDQIETALMRLGRQSSELGGRGILMCRRWGMGQKNDLEWAGYEGLSKWMIRPLLDVSKDRILATCEENELSYVTDSTNFQPAITLRNALRAVLSKDKFDQTHLPPDIQNHLRAINQTISSFPNLSIDLNSPRERLRAAIKTIDSFASDIESQATIQLEHARLASPPGTFILSSHYLQEITNPLLRRAMILRILRYISFHPWGSVRSQARRSRHSLDHIIENVWNPSPFTSRGIRPIVAGGGVLWRPVLVDPLKATANFLGRGGRGILGWMAVRQPPYNPEKMAAYGLEDSLNVDITGTLREALKAWDQGRGSGPQTIQILWDCRFLLDFDLASIPQHLIHDLFQTPPSSSSPKIAIRWWTKYYYPKVVLVPRNGKVAWSEKEDREVVLHSDVKIGLNPVLVQSRPRMSTPYLNKVRNEGGEGLKGNTPIVVSEWVTTRWIRILDPF